jgi:hypothetical protein
MDRRESLKSIASLTAATLSTVGANLSALAQSANQPAAKKIPSVMTMDIEYLNHSRELIRKNDQSIFVPYFKLNSTVNALMQLKPESVTYKTMVPASGSKNDYLSLAPYWWPDPSKPDGLPFIRRDGEFNPSAKNADSDSVRNQVMCLSCLNLSLAYHFSGDKRFAEKTADVIRTWFLNTATRMNPNLNHAQAVMGRVTGRGIGIIDTRNYWMVIDAIGLIEPAKLLRDEEVTALRKWFGDYAKWLVESPNGKQEFSAYNNHGIFYEMQLTNFALFAGNIPLAQESVDRAYDLRMKAQITAKGEQWAELERTTPSHYTAFNLDAMTNLARYSEFLRGQPIWQRVNGERGLRVALDWTLPFATGKQVWPFKELKDTPDKKFFEVQSFLPVYLKAERAYGGGRFREAAFNIPVELEMDVQEWKDLASYNGNAVPRVSNTIDRLIWPPIVKAAI